MNFLNAEVVGDGSIYQFVLSLGLAVVFGMALAYFVEKFSRVVGNKSQYYAIFPVLIPTMVLIISVIKSSLALSLGLVGALSIIRFRTPVKDPEELTYIFIAVACGLGLGAGQAPITTITLIVVLFVLFLLNQFYREKPLDGLYLDIAVKTQQMPNEVLSTIRKVFSSLAVNYEVRRFLARQGKIDFTFFIDTGSEGRLESLIEKFNSLNLDMELTIINRSRENS